MTTPLARNCTLLMIAAPDGVAVALMAWGVLTGMVVPTVGRVMFTVGAPAADVRKVTALLVFTLPALSVAVAVTT